MDTEMISHLILNVFKQNYRLIQPNIVEDCFTLYSLLKEKGYDTSNKLNFNDCDNNAWFIHHLSDSIFCLTDQNCKFVVFIHDFGREEYMTLGNLIYVYQYYPDFNYKDFDDGYYGITETTVPINYFLKHQNSRDHFFSDCIDGNKYISLPNLECLLEREHFQQNKKDEQHPIYHAYSPILTLGNGYRSIMEQTNGIGICNPTDFRSINSFLFDLEFTIDHIKQNMEK